MNQESAVFEVQCETHSGVSNLFLHNTGNLSEATTASIKIQFGMLLRWAQESLDIFREEIQSLLYPMFVHSFLDLVGKNQISEGREFLETYRKDFELQHGDEIQKLSGLNDACHLRENQVAVLFRTNKYNMTMTYFAFQLFLQYLQEEKALLFIKILNQFIRVKSTIYTCCINM